MIADDVTLSTDTTTHTPESVFRELEKLVTLLLVTPGSQVNLERSGNRCRLRFKSVRSAGEKSAKRWALELPSDTALIDRVAALIQAHRNGRKGAGKAEGEHDASMALLRLRGRILNACQRGRVIRRRIGLVFDMAADLGHETLRDFVGREPWLAAGRRAGSRREKARSHFYVPLSPQWAWLGQVLRHAAQYQRKDVDEG